MKGRDGRERLKALKLQLLDAVSTYCRDTGHDIKGEFDSYWVDYAQMTKEERLQTGVCAGFFRIGIKADAGFSV